MQTFCLFFLMTFASVGAYGQKFIEVVASDSVLLKPKTITFEVKVGENSGGMEMLGMKLGREQDEQDPDLILEKQKNLRKFLTNNNINFYEKPTGDLSLKSIKAVTTPYYIDVKSYAEGVKLLEKLKSYEGIQASIDEVTYEKTEAIEKLLLQRILARAKKDAALLAGLSGLKIGAIGEIRENVGNETDEYNNLFGKIMKQNPLFGAMQRQLKEEYRRTFTVRFQIVD